MKRYRRKDAKPGQLLVYYGKLPHENPDIIFAWGGGGAAKCDANLLTYVFSGKRQRHIHDPEELKKNGGYPIAFDPSLLEELETRGYDLTTLKFSIEKKKVIT